MVGMGEEDTEWWLITGLEKKKKILEVRFFFIMHLNSTMIE